MVPENEKMQEKIISLLIEKIKESKTLSISPYRNTHYNEEKYTIYTFKFDNFNISTTLKTSESFLADARYGRLELNKDVAVPCSKQQCFYTVADIVVQDKQGQCIFEANCIQFRRQIKRQLISTDLGHKIFVALFNRTVQEKIRRDKEEAEQQKKRYAMLEGRQRITAITEEKKEQDTRSAAIMSQALDKIAKL